MKKLINLSLALLLSFYSGVVPFAVYAQEAVPDPTPTEEFVQSEPTPVADPVVASTPEPTPQPTTIPTPTIPDRSSSEYDVWKAAQEIKDDAKEAREDEWEANEEDSTWVATHGGNEQYYVSGQWQADQDAAQAAAAAAAAALVTPTPTPISVLETIQPTPLASCETAPASLSSGEAEALGASVSNDNCAVIDNSSTASGNSGTNTQSGNDGSVTMTTAGASANGQLVNNGNTNITDSSDNLSSSQTEMSDGLSEGTDADGVSTESSPDGLVDVSTTENLDVDNNNQAIVNNTMTVEGTSGANLVENNDGTVQLTTGDIELIANMLNILNLNITGDDFMHLIVNIFGQLDGTLDLDDIASALGYSDESELEILATSDATASVSSTENTTINNDNQAVVNNELNVTGTSGANEVVGNDGTADIITGRIQILANMMNFINTNFSGEKWSFIMVNIFGSLNGNLILPGTDQYLDGQDTAGAQAAGDQATATSNDSQTVSNTNGVVLSNNINANGVTGENVQAGNDDEGHTAASGEVDVMTNIMNYLNYNLTGNNWVFLIVNVFGKWMGQIVGFAGNGVMDAPTEGSFAALSVGSGSSVPAAVATGSDVANATSTVNSDVNNQNNAVVNNELNLNGISGQNNVSGNDGTTTVQTGWVEIDANLLNIINMNVTGRSWMVVFLNVFGDFFGNMYFGQHNVPQPAVATGGAETTHQSNSSNQSNNQQSNSSNTSNTSNTSSPVSTPTAVPARQVARVESFEVDTQEGEVLSYLASPIDAGQTNYLVTHNSSLLSLLISWLSDMMHTTIEESLHNLLARIEGSIFS